MNQASEKVQEATAGTSKEANKRMLILLALSMSTV